MTYTKIKFILRTTQNLPYVVPVKSKVEISQTCVAFSEYMNFIGKSLSEALLFTEHRENMLFTKKNLNVRNNFCTQHVLLRFELGIFMH